jgi:outer membrane receptor protein involved in Fe transport
MMAASMMMMGGAGSAAAWAQTAPTPPAGSTSILDMLGRPDALSPKEAQAVLAKLRQQGITPPDWLVARARAASQEVRREDDSNDIVVTGRASLQARTLAQTSYAMSTITSKDLQMRAPIGVAAALQQIPGFDAGSSGEASGGVQVRGIPPIGGAGYGTVALLEDGLPMQADPGLGWLNGDESLRIDQTVGRIEVVRGGPSTILYSNAPGAAINFITRPGTETFKSQLRYEYGDYNMHRVDSWISGPLGKGGWRYFAGGYWRTSDAQRYAGYNVDRGGQFRANVSRAFAKGALAFGVKRIDEKISDPRQVVFTNDAHGNPVDLPGFDSLRDTVAGPESRRFDLPTDDGVFHFDAGRGTNVKLTQVSAEGRYDFGRDWSITERARYRDSIVSRNGIWPYHAYSANDYLKGETTEETEPVLLYRDTGIPFAPRNQNGNGVVLLDLARSYTLPLNEFLSDTRLNGSFSLHGRHDVAIGFYFARVNEIYDRINAGLLTDYKNNASVLLFKVRKKSTGEFVPGAAMTNDQGVLRFPYPSLEHDEGDSATRAVYVSDEWHFTDKLRFEGGLRWEGIAIHNPTAVADCDDCSGSHHFAKVAWTTAANYQFQPHFGSYIRYTKAIRLPNISDYIDQAGADPVTRTLNLTEAGIKYFRPKIDINLTGFRTVYNNYEVKDFRLVKGWPTPFRVFANTYTIGLELEAKWRPVDWFDLRGQWTHQDAHFSDLQIGDASGKQIDYSGHKLDDMKADIVMITPGLNLLDDRLRIQSDIRYTGPFYYDAANQIRISGMTTASLNMLYSPTDKLDFNLIVDNLTNVRRMVSGNPRAGRLQNIEAGQSLMIGAPMYRRSARLALTYRY